MAERAGAVVPIGADRAEADHAEADHAGADRAGTSAAGADGDGTARDGDRTGVPAVEARDVVKVFGRGEDAFRALDGVSVRIGANEFFTLLGPSGCGKTTLLRLIAGFEHPSRGTILLRGTDIVADPPYRRPVNTVFQSYALFPHMTVERNVAFGLQMLGRSKGETARRVGEVLELVRLEDLRRRATSELSGGQQQRVALARALAPSPAVLLLDEPLSALDYQLRKEMQIELKRMQHESGITFVFVTHDQEEALTMSDRVAVMSAGRILQIGTPREIYERPADRFVASFIGESNFLDGEIVAAPEPVTGTTADASRGGAAAAALVRVRLDAGGTLVAERGPDAPRTGRCTVVVRPEHATLSDEGAGAGDARGVGHGDGRLPGTLANVVYSGTDTHHHVTLADGSRFVVRSQNRRAPARDDGHDGERIGDDALAAAEGDAVAVRIAPGVARLLDETPRARGDGTS